MARSGSISTQIHCQEASLQRVIDEHFILLAYPFRHDLPRSRPERNAKSIDSSWTHWWCRQDDAESALAVRSLRYFHPHIQESLHVEASRMAVYSENAHASVKNQLCHVDSIDQLVQNALDQNQSIRLTTTGSRLRLSEPIELIEHGIQERGDVERFRFVVDWIDAQLFPGSIGFLILKVRMIEREVTASDLRRFIRQLRQVKQYDTQWSLPTWRQNIGGRVVGMSASSLTDELMSTFTEQEQPLDASTNSHAKRFNEVFGQHFLHYVFMSTVDDGGQHTLESESSQHNSSQFLVQSKDLLALQLAMVYDFSSPAELPEHQYIEKLIKHSRFQTWANWSAIAIQDSAVFVTDTKDGFTTDVLPRNVENEYFELYLLSRFQRYRLLLFSTQLVRKSRSYYENIREARSLWREFIAFQSRFWSPEVTRSAQGNELYSCFRNSLNLTELFHEVNGEVNTIQEYFERQDQHRTTVAVWALSVLNFFVVPISILATIYAPILVKSGTWRELGILAAIIYVVTLALLGVYALLKRR